MTVTRTCPTCGFAGTYLTDRTADHHHGAHSCARQQHLAGVTLRRDARAANRTSRDCRHVRTTHVHGTRVAYVKDRCRCEHCTVANTAASRRTQRARTYGRWQPYVPAAPTRERIRELRTAGFGLRRIAQLAGVSTTTLRAITETGSDDRPVRDKIRPETAAAVLAIDPAHAERAEHSTVDATGTRRRLQALVTMGWSPRQLAARLDRSSTHLARTMTGARVTVRTAADVRAMYDEIWDVRPPQDSGAARAAHALAISNGWLPPLAWDDIDTDADRYPEHLNQASSDFGDLDEIAIERAVAGDGIRLGQLTPAEQQEVVRRMTQHGQSIREIAGQLGTTARTVSRRRRSVADAA